MNTTQAQTPSGAFAPGRGGNQITPSFSPHPRAGVQLVVCGVGDLSGVIPTDIGHRAVNLIGIRNGFFTERTQR